MKLLPMLTACALGLALTATASAQVSFYADLHGGAEVPPNASTAGGWARMTLNPDLSLTYEVHTWNLSGTASHIHAGAPGVSGGIVVPLVGGPTTWAGTTSPLSTTEVAELRASGWYVNVHSAAFPGGEIRGQIEPRPTRFAAFLNGKQEVPANASTHKGNASFDLNLASNDVTYVVTTNVVGGTASHLHTGAIGVNGGIAFPLIGGPTTWSGTLFGIGEDDFSDFQTMGLYCNVHTSSFPGGEIRGQVVPTGIKYGDVPAAPMDLDVGGAPVSGGTISLSVSGGHPNSLVLLLGSLGPGAAYVKGMPFLVDPALLFLGSLTLPLGPGGSITLPSTLPDVMANFDVYFQAFNTSGGPLQASNGLRLPLADLPF